METKYIDVPHKKWGIVVIYDYDTTYDYVDLMAIMRSFGLSQRDAKRAINILSSYNTGMAVSLDTLRMSAVFISKTTSSSEFWNTMNHELYHCSVAILDYYDEPYDGEGAAHLQGELMRQAVLLVGEPCS